MGHFAPRVGRLVPKKGSIGTVSTKTHSGDPDGTGGFGGFLGSGRFLALKFRFYKKFHRQNWLEIVGKQNYARGRPKQCFCFVCCFVVVVGFGGPGGGFGAPGGVFFLCCTTSSSVLRYFYLY